MAKFKPGIPDTFTLNVDPVRDLGDYLDEPRPTPVAPRKAREEAVPPPAQPFVPESEAVVAQPVATAVIDSLPTAHPLTPPPAMPAAPVLQQAEPVVTPVLPTVSMTPAKAVPPRAEPEREERGGKEKAPRREISMTPETLRMSDELLEVIRSGSGQRDTKANELMHALVLLVYEALDHVDPHSIPKRGRWGTPTARAYPLEIKNAFLRALLEKYGQDGAKYPVTTAA